MGTRNPKFANGSPFFDCTWKFNDGECHHLGLVITFPNVGAGPGPSPSPEAGPVVEGTEGELRIHDVHPPPPAFEAGAVGGVGGASTVSCTASLMEAMSC
jgi:hypothetical protein